MIFKLNTATGFIFFNTDHICSIKVVATESVVAISTLDGNLFHLLAREATPLVDYFETISKKMEN